MTQTQRKSSQSPLGSRNILFQVGESTPISSLDISEYMDHDMVHGVLVEYVWTQWNNHCFFAASFPKLENQNFICWILAYWMLKIIWSNLWSPKCYPDKSEMSSQTAMCGLGKERCNDPARLWGYLHLVFTEVFYPVPLYRCLSVNFLWDTVHD